MSCACLNPEIQGHVYTCASNSCITREQYRDFILDAFTGSDPVVAQILDIETVDFFLDMAVAEYNSSDIIFLSAYRSACYTLMQAYSYQFDKTERFGESHARTDGKSESDERRAIQASGITLLSEMQGTYARYGDYSRASMDAEASRNGCSHSDSYGISTTDDIGEGSRKTRNRARSILKASKDAQAHRGVDGTTTDIGASSGCDFSHSYSGKAEDHQYSLIFSLQETSDKAHSTRQMSNTSTSNGETDIARQDWQIANSKKVAVDGTRKDACAQFKANVIQTGKDQAKSDSTNEYHAERHQKQRAEGNGIQRGSQDLSNRSSSQSESTTDKTALATKKNHSWRFSTISSYKNSQKYDTLSRLYDVLTRQIEEVFEDNNRTCAPVSNAPNMIPFIESANCRNTSLTIMRLLWRFPYLTCFGYYPNSYEY